MDVLRAVKPVYNSHSSDQVFVVFADRWYLYRGAGVSLRWHMDQPTVAFVDRQLFYIQEWFTLLRSENNVVLWQIDSITKQLLSMYKV